MINYKNNNNRRNKFRANNRNFRANGSNISNLGLKNKFQRRHSGGNNNNAPKLIEKYNNLAREALSSGDKILSENYYQYADHFLRVIENRNLVQNNSKLDLGDSSTKEKSDDKIILKDKKDLSPLQTQNTEEI